MSAKNHQNLNHPADLSIRSRMIGTETQNAVIGDTKREYYSSCSHSSTSQNTKTPIPVSSNGKSKMLNYDDYVAAANDTAHPERKIPLYTEDCICGTPLGKIEGRDAIVGAYSANGPGVGKVREKIVPIFVAYEGNTIVVELDTWFLPAEDFWHRSIVL